MSALVPNQISSYSLTEEEQGLGETLTTLQKQVIQNRIAMCAEEKLALTFDPTEPALYMQAEAEKRGEMNALLYMIELAEYLDVKNNPAAPII